MTQIYLLNIFSSYDAFESDDRFETNLGRLGAYFGSLKERRYSSMIKKNCNIDFDLRQLEIFKNVVELKSFSRAAEKVCLAQASVSERIANLESMVGVALLDRLGRGIVPTRAGELLYKHALLLLEMKKTASMEMQDFLGLKRGEIRMGGSTIPGEYILPALIGGFREKFPLVSIVLEISDSKEVETRVLKGEYELGVIGSQSTDKNMITHELWNDELVLAVHPKHKWAKKKAVSVDKLYDEPFILRERGSGTLNIFDQYLKSTGIKKQDNLQIVARLGTSTAVKEGIKAGLGISILSSRAIQTELNAGLIKSLKIKSLSMTRSFYLIRDKRKITSPLCNAMIKFLKDTS